MMQSFPFSICDMTTTKYVFPLLLQVCLWCTVVAMLKQNSLTMQMTRGVIIGNGRIGNFMFESNGRKDYLLSGRDDPIPEGDGPIYICTR